MSVQKIKAKTKKPTFKKVAKGMGLQYPKTSYSEAAFAVMEKYHVESINQTRWKIMFANLFELVLLVAGRNPNNEKIVARCKDDLMKLDGYENSISRSLKNDIYVEQF